MKIKNVTKGMLVQRKHSTKPYIGEVKDISQRGLLLLRSYLDDRNHFLNARFLKPLIICIESDGDMYHAYCPILVGLHTCGDTIEETETNLKDAIKAYLASMVKHNEMPKDFSAFRGNK